MFLLRQKKSNPGIRLHRTVYPVYCLTNQFYYEKV